MNAGSDLFLRNARRCALIIAAILSIVALTVNWKWSAGIIIGCMLNEVFIGINSLYANSISQNCTRNRLLRTQIFASIIKYPVAAIIVFFVVKLGYTAIPAFILGFSLVYLTLTVGAIRSLVGK